MFKIGEYVIYKRDLCTINDIIERNNKKYYKLSPVEDKSLIINVPVENKMNYLRYPISKKEAEKLIEKIPLIKELNTNEKLIENEYKNLMKTNKHEDLIKIIKTTYLRNKERQMNGKKIAEKDTDYFQKAEYYLYNELRISLNMTYEECKNFIIETLTRK